MKLSFSLLYLLEDLLTCFTWSNTHPKKKTFENVFRIAFGKDFNMIYNCTHSDDFLC